jgi:dipeptide/tripeptide permease
MTAPPAPAPSAPASRPAKFPALFWTANSIELFERAAYYSMASFMVIYLTETLGMSPTTATFLNGTLLWGIIYFLPILSGALADKFGFKKTLSVAFVLIALGYIVVGNLPAFWPKLSGAEAGQPVNFILPVIAGICFIGIGGSVVKPCVAGTVQKIAAARATLAFGIFYMVINIGSISGRTVSYFVRTKLGIPAIFQYPSTIFALVGLFVVLVLYKEPHYTDGGAKDGPKAPKRTLGQALLGMFTVLANVKFLFFIIVVSLFWFLYIQLYNLMPLYLRFVDPDAPVELYTLANPVMIVAFQLVITKMVKRWTPVRSMVLGATVVTLGMLMNVIPALLSADPSRKVGLLGLGLPVAGLFMFVSIVSMAVGEMMASPRVYEFMGAIAPKGQEGLYLGYQSLPIALASMVGGPIGGNLFERYVSQPVAAGRPAETLPMWLIIVGIGVASIVGLAVYDAWVKREAKVRTAGRG